MAISYDIYKDGLKIYTTINPRMQEYAEEAVCPDAYPAKSVECDRKIKNGTVWKEHENVLQNAMKKSDRWGNYER